MNDLISRQAAINALNDGALVNYQAAGHNNGLVKAIDVINGLQSAQPTLYGYSIDHLNQIARILQKENLPPERVAEALSDIAQIVEIVELEFVETLEKEASKWTI